MLAFEVDVTGGLADFAGIFSGYLEYHVAQVNREVIAPGLEAVAKKILARELYDIPIPVRKSGKPRWQRTGELREREQAFADGMRVYLMNDTPHAKPRAALGQANPPNAAGRRAGIQSGLSPTRPLNWQKMAVEARHAWLREQYQQAVRDAWARMNPRGFAGFAE